MGCAAGAPVRPAEIPPTPLHTFPALPAAPPPQGCSGRTSASELPPPAFGSVSTGPAPGRRQRLGHLQDTKGNSALSRGRAGPQHRCGLQGVAEAAWEPDEGGECEERWCNGEETVLVVSEALINSGAGSQGRWHQPCGTASHASVWTQVGVFLAGRSAPLEGGSLGQD